MPTPVTNSSHTAESGSSRKPASALSSTGPLAPGKVSLPVSLPSQVYITFSKGALWWAAAKSVYCHTARQDQAKATTTVPTQKPLTADLDRRRPTKNITAALKMGS